jgi:cytochrome c-type biogenesis protein
MLEVTGIGVTAAFAAGAVSFLSPCVLPLVPGYVSYVAGQTATAEAAPGPGAPAWPRVLGLSLSFVLGFSTVFVLLGAGAGALSELLLTYRDQANLVGGALVILFGLLTAGLVSPAWLARDLRWHGSLPGGGPVSAYLLGVAFGFGWTPCIGPVLGAILTVTAAQGGGGGVVLLAVYSLGLGVPFVLAALFSGGFAARLKALGRAGRVLRLAAGGVMVAMGLAMVTGRLTEFAYWLLSTFPALGRIG